MSKNWVLTPICLPCWQGHWWLVCSTSEVKHWTDNFKLIGWRKHYISWYRGLLWCLKVLEATELSNMTFFFTTNMHFCQAFFVCIRLAICSSGPRIWQLQLHPHGVGMSNHRRNPLGLADGPKCVFSGGCLSVHMICIFMYCVCKCICILYIYIYTCEQQLVIGNTPCIYFR